MNISVRPTVPSEAEALSQIQKAAFLPLYEQFRDPGNPYFRGPEDILRRLNKNFRQFTIFLDGKIVGGIFYRLYGALLHDHVMGAGEYYLQRVYIHPEYQCMGIARTAIALCEKEFPDAKFMYVDFPEVLEKNRKCYSGAGYRDTGIKCTMEDAPTLAVFKKAVHGPSKPGNVEFPLIYEAAYDELPECLEVIHRSFGTVADEFGLTKENCPKHTGFLPLSALETHFDLGWRMFGLYAGKKIIGYMSLSREQDGFYELHNLAVLPEYRHRGFGKLLLDHAKSVVESENGKGIKIGIIEESTVLKAWYEENGFTHIGTKKFDHLPFTCGYLQWSRNETVPDGTRKEKL